MTPFDRLRSIGRRELLWAAGGMAAGGVLGQGVVDPIMEPVASRVSEALYGSDVSEPFVYTKHPWQLLPSAHRRQQAANAMWLDGQDIENRISEVDPGGMHAVITFKGDRPRYVRVGKGLSVLPGEVVGRPVVEAPTPAYGRFVYERAASCYYGMKPLFHACFGPIGGKHVNYLSLMLPTATGVVSVGYPSSEWPGEVRPASARRDEGPRSRGTDATI